MKGVFILVGSVVGIIVYGWLLYSSAIIVLQITAFIAVVAILGILAWIGWAMATTSPPAPIEDISISDLETAQEPTGSAAEQKQTDTSKP